MHVSNKTSIAIHCLIFIHEFSKDHKVTSELLSLSTGCNPVTIRNIISNLNKNGIIEVKFGTGGTSIIAPSQEITLYRICKAVDPEAIDKMIGIHHHPSPYCPVGININSILNNTYDKVKQDLIDSMNAITLDTIIDEYHEHIK